jgi:phospholipase D1/2
MAAGSAPGDKQPDTASGSPKDAPPYSPQPILRAGSNCWRQTSSRRVALFDDVASYFRSLRSALLLARESVLIMGWDISSETRLLPEEPGDGLPVELRPLLDRLALRRSQLHVHILLWDFAMVFAAERELLPVFSLGWDTHRRVHFRLDGKHPPGACHHEKLLVIDDALAFVGGIDLTVRRWDTSRHASHDPRRAPSESCSARAEGA